MKKYILLIFLFITGGSLTQAQDSSAVRERLYHIVSSYREYPNVYRDELQKQNIDSLRGYSTIADYNKYAHDTSVVMRYIGFMWLMIADDEKAYEFLAAYILDSTKLFREGAHGIADGEPYNNVIVDEYSLFLGTYLDGAGCCTGHYFCYASPGKDFEAWERKHKRLTALLRQNHLIAFMDYSDDKGNAHVYDEKKYVQQMKKYSKGSKDFYGDANY